MIAATSDPWRVVRDKQERLAIVRVELSEAQEKLRDTQRELRSARETMHVLWCVVAVLFLTCGIACWHHIADAFAALRGVL